MEGKTLILSVLLMSLLMAQIQVDAKSCCPSVAARNVYNVCRLAKKSREFCCQLSGCKIVKEKKCTHPPYIHEILKTTGDDVSEFCKVGCLSSLCGALTTFQNSAASEIVNEAVEKCDMVCSTTCTKGSTNAAETA
ncbi:PREDICTED: probable thionin-2.4 [Camelina sativa]|uniref:Probable thionin-2.4 n=1 Tax=Camelina sativa TaxID=90675 RepID=A0ABM0V548_CAMSA|nr:PREDICTED: probable thionin-2.4 [Camelina sativa]